MSSLLRSIQVVAVFALATAQPAAADFVAYTPEPELLRLYAPSTNYAFQFRPTVPILVTELGFFDSFKDGLTVAHPIGIFDVVTQNLLASTTVGPGTGNTLDGWFRYNAIAPLALNAGQSYMVVGYIPINSMDLESNLFHWQVSFDPRITYRGFFYTYTEEPVPGLVFPTRTDDNRPEEGFGMLYYGPNFKFQPAGAAVPEPASLILLGIGALGLLRYGRRRRTLSPS